MTFVICLSHLGYSTLSLTKSYATHTYYHLFESVLNRSKSQKFYLHIHSYVLFFNNFITVELAILY